MKLLSQRDPEWSGVRIGNSNTTVGADGCTLTSVSMVLEKLRGYPCNPGDAARWWKFTNRGLIIWKAINFRGMKFVKRGYGSHQVTVSSYANDPKTGCVLELDHGAHWVYLEKVEDKTFHIVDPWTGKRQKGLGGRSFTGYALFEQVARNVPDWLKPFWKKAQDKGLGLKDHATKLTIPMLIEALIEMKLIDKPKTELKVGEFIAALDKIKQRW